MKEKDAPDSFPERIREERLAVAVALAEQRQKAGDASPDSRFGPFGGLLKGIVRRLIRFSTIRQADFNAAAVEALKQIDAGLRDASKRADATDTAARCS